VAASTLYGGSIGLLGLAFERLGITTAFVDPKEPENFARAMRPETRVVFGETLGNPLVNVLDIAAIADVAHAHGVPLIIDNTVASPYLCNPLQLGADIVVHSATKYIGGHGTTMGGVLIESGRFPWDNGKFPDMVEPSRAYHGVKFYETFGDFGYTMKARMEVNRTYGGVLSPMSAWLLLQAPKRCTCACRRTAATRWLWRATCSNTRASPGSTTPVCPIRRITSWRASSFAPSTARPAPRGCSPSASRGALRPARNSSTPASS